MQKFSKHAHRILMFSFNTKQVYTPQIIDGIQNIPHLKVSLSTISYSKSVHIQVQMVLSKCNQRELMEFSPFPSISSNNLLCISHFINLLQITASQAFPF
ncbi:hypothetical protein L1049_015597 [Liquidambar formosana]|uniref:Uncharacterized protein n=1 Tax=Liquidambar formosana TaxID=63359 RepID=A0AAP0X2M4_LIQFO